MNPSDTLDGNYQNEINAYSTEIQICTDVSSGYNMSRKYGLWFNQ